MNLVLPTCRSHFTSQDVEFISTVLCRKKEDTSFLADLLTDPGLRDRILDDAKLVEALQDHADCVRISCYLYFYLLVRSGLRNEGLDDREVADYVGEMLAEFMDARRLLMQLSTGEIGSEYVTDMQQALQKCPLHDQFAGQAHMGNILLFATGLYPQRICERQGRHGAPGLSFYESVGQASYAAASHLHGASEMDLSELLEKLSACFHQIRVALNHIREKFLFVEPPVRLIVAP